MEQLKGDDKVLGGAKRLVFFNVAMLKKMRKTDNDYFNILTEILRWVVCFQPASYCKNVKQVEENSNIPNIPQIC